jgi:hypothetical protein
MAHRLTTLGTAFALALVVACSGSKATELDAPSAADPSAAALPTDTTDDPDGPHALGTIVLGESHVSGGVSRRLVRVSFEPDSAASGTPARGRMVAGCELVIASEMRGASEVAFDGGTVAIRGAGTSLSLSPPYTDVPDEDGAPFRAGAPITVSGSGAADAGFDRFEETFTATEPLVTSPPLANLPRASVFSTGALPITWLAGADRIVVTVSGKGGVLRCETADATGHFELPREVVTTALGGAEDLVLTVARERTEVRKGKKTKGHLEAAPVQPAGWLSFSTTSTETASFHCSGAECTGTTLATCQDCRTSLCKTEFDACTADATCPFLRTCLDACKTSSCRNACFVKWPEPVAKAKNGALYKCQCINTCSAECKAECT